MDSLIARPRAVNPSCSPYGVGKTTSSWDTLPAAPKPQRPKSEDLAPMLVKGVRYHTLSIPDPKGKVAAEIYRVYPRYDCCTGLTIGSFRLWRAGRPSYTLHRDAGGIVTCTCKGYTAWGYCKHQRAASEVGLV